MPLKYLSLVCLAMAWMAIANPILSQEFRISSEIYVGQSQTAIASNLTLFSEQLIFDFRMSDDSSAQPEEVALYDLRQKRFVLLDLTRKVRTEITDLQMDKLIDNLARETQANDRSKFLIADNFQEETDWANNTLRLTSENIEYFFQGRQPEDPAIMPLYFSFLDNFTKLSATDPKKIPPFPRMKLNQRIKQLGWIPSEVQVSLNANDFFKETMEAKSKHVLTQGLTTGDRELIANARRDWQQFPLLELPEFRQVRGQTVVPEQKLAGKDGSVTTIRPR